MIPSPKHVIFGVVVLVVGAGSMIGLAQGRGAVPPRSGSALSTGSGASMATVAPEYRIGPEDVLDIKVKDHEELAMLAIQVRPDGRISMPLLNDVQAAGLTPMELRTSIIKALAPQWKVDDVSVVVRDVRSAKFSVIGSVRTASRFDLRSQITVLEAIAMAGGLIPDYADAEKISVVHADGTRAAFNYKQFMKDPASQANFLLRPGDIVVVPEK